MKFKTVVITVAITLFFSMLGFSQSSGGCWEDSITLYHANLIHHGDRERAIENATWYYNECIREDEEGGW